MKRGQEVFITATVLKEPDKEGNVTVITDADSKVVNLDISPIYDIDDMREIIGHNCCCRKIHDGLGRGICWKKLSTREADEEERTEGYAFMYDCEIPEIGEEVFVSDGKNVWIDTWIEFDIGVGFENAEAPCWWMALPEAPKETRI